VVDERVVLIERRGPVGLVILNRPAKLNALNNQLIAELETALTDLDGDPDIGCIVITGAGERAFSAGGDMAEQIADAEAGRPGRQSNTAGIIRGCRTPTIAAIRGYCFGGGALLVINCDIRIGGSDARFKFPGATYGRGPGGAMLPRIVGDAKARELLFTGDEIGAEEALRIGLLNQVVPPTEVVESSVRMGERIAANSPVAVRALKAAINAALPVEAALEVEHELNQGMGRSADSFARFRKAAERVVGR
jgi:enoyl-CoA hydratase/carnithine racemase